MQGYSLRLCNTHAPVVKARAVTRASCASKGAARTVERRADERNPADTLKSWRLAEDISKSVSKESWN